MCVFFKNLDQCFRRRCRCKKFHIQSSGGPFGQRSGFFSAIMVKGIIRNNYVNLF